MIVSATQPQKFVAFIVEPMALSSTLPNPPDFGVSSPPAESLAAGHNTRIVKDILHCGRHKVGFDAAGKEVYWTVTPQVLAQILQDFKAAKKLNAGANLGKTHGDAELLIHPDDLIAPIDDLKIDKGVLWMSAYVAPSDAEYLRNPARLVSPAIIPNHERAGHRFAQYLTHVAVTDRPVLANQRPFIAMADTAGSGTMDIVAAVNMLLEAVGASALPDDTTPENIVDRLIGVASGMGMDTNEETETADEPLGGEMDLGELPGVPAAMQDTLKKVFSGYDARIKSLSDELATRKLAEATAAKKAFDVRVGELMGQGVPKTVLDGKIALANKLGSYDLAFLDGLASPLSTHSQAKKLADGSAPAITPGVKSTEDTRKSVAEDIAKRRGISLEAAMKFVP
jgi:hypothetical protein